MSNAIADFIITAGLYDRITITEQNIQQLIRLVNGEERIDVFCPQCKEKRVFHVRPVIASVYKDQENNSAYLLGHALSTEQQLIANSRYPGALRQHREPLNWTWNKHAGEGARVFVLKCCCAMDETHHLDYVLLSQSDDIIKIGQYPSVADLSFPELRMYRKVISNEDMRELRQAIGLHAQGIGVGAFVYLRRILERMVMNIMEETISSGMVGEEIRREKFSEKIKALKDCLPDVLSNNPVIYGILSRGVHELSDEECLRSFPVVYQCVLLMLDEWEEKRRRMEKKSELSKALAGLASST